MSNNSNTKKFEDISEGFKEKNSAWLYFLREKSGQCAKCKECGNEIKTSGGSTSGLHTHLRTAHNINILKRSQPDSIPSPSTSGSNQQPNKLKSKITSYFCNQNDESFPAVLSKLTAVDGIAFKIFITSVELRKSLMARGFQVPKSSTTISDIVLKYGKSVQEKIAEELANIRGQGTSFSLTFDEWTSVKNRRYICLNLHIQNKFWNLGLIRVHGSLPAESCVELINKRLMQYGLNLDRDIVCITTDGASVMQKVGRLIKCHQQLCFAHAIQLGVIDVLYKKKQYGEISTNITAAIESDSDSDDVVEDTDGFEIIQSSDDLNELIDDICPIIKKVRKVVTIFRRSPTKNDSILQKYVVAEFGKELSLILDTRTRWNSLLFMLERFYQLKDCIKKALIDLKSTINFNESELNLLSCTISALSPIKLAVEALCRRDATLLSADATIIFMIDNLGNETLSSRLKESLTRRVIERRTNFSSLLQYLHKAHQNQDSSFGIHFERLTKKNIVNMIVSLTQRLFVSTENNLSLSDVESDSDIVLDFTSNMPSLKEKLDLAINKEVEQNIIRKSRHPNSFERTIKKEIAIFEENGSRGSNLQMVYEYLKTIPPTSVEAERIFSSSGRINTKIRSSLKDDSLDNLCFLRAYFTSKKN